MHTTAIYGLGIWAPLTISLLSFCHNLHIFSTWFLGTFLSQSQIWIQHKDEYHCGLWLGHLGATDSDWDHSTNEQPGLGLSLLRSFTCYTPQFPWGWVCSCFCLYPSSSSSNIHLVHSTWGHLSFCICTICVFVFCILFVYVVVFAFIKANSCFSLKVTIIVLCLCLVFILFYQTQVRSLPCLVRPWVTQSCCWDLADVTLAFEDLGNLFNSHATTPCLT